MSGLELSRLVVLTRLQNRGQELSEQLIVQSLETDEARRIANALVGRIEHELSSTELHWVERVKTLAMN